MFDTPKVSKQKINLAEYRDKVLGCWTGKNIGGTLGGPFEGKRDMNDATFYIQDLKGKPAPNDDLDLQLVWLLAVEENGLFRINERLLGEYWLNLISGPWNEYGVCKANIRNGLIPPLSGACNNERWKWSNGAWIRSEVWACLCPGSPDEAAMFAYFDSCCDHVGEGIYAELFTATLESMAFIENNIRKLIEYGLSRIPANSRVARAVKLACNCYDTQVAFKDAREAIVKDSADLGWFQAPGNLGFVILGLLYGEGDFSRSVVLANNCGDDTDCTAGTVGAILGIMYGRSKLPKEWTDPIGESIQTCSIETYGRNNILPFPETLDELTDRVLHQAVKAQQENRTMVQLTDEATAISSEYRENALNSAPVVKRIWERNPYSAVQEFPFGNVGVEYANGPYVEPGKPIELTFCVSGTRWIEKLVSITAELPEGWTAIPSNECIVNSKGGGRSIGKITIIPADFSGVYCYLPVTIAICDRFAPFSWNIVLQKKVNDMTLDNNCPDQDFWDKRNRMQSEISPA